MQQIFLSGERVAEVQFPSSNLRSGRKAAANCHLCVHRQGVADGVGSRTDVGTGLAPFARELMSGSPAFAALKVLLPAGRKASIALLKSYEPEMDPTLKRRLWQETTRSVRRRADRRNATRNLRSGSKAAANFSLDLPTSQQEERWKGQAKAK
eukprot:s2483_g6.t3